MGTNDLPLAQLAAFDLMRVDSQSLATVVEKAISKTRGLKGENAANAFAGFSMLAARQDAEGDEAHALYTRAQIYRECLSSCTKMLADANMDDSSEENRARLLYGLAHAHVKMAPRLDGTSRINYNIGEIISIAKSLPLSGSAKG